MKKVFHIPLLAALPALLAGCNHGPNISEYQRQGYNSYAECAAAYHTQIQAGLQNPCIQNRSYVSGGFLYYGPYIYNSGGTSRYVGYDANGNPAGRGVSYNKAHGTFGTFKTGTSRGGFTSTGRGRGGFGG